MQIVLDKYMVLTLFEQIIIFTKDENKCLLKIKTDLKHEILTTNNINVYPKKYAVQ